ncbi:MAG: hypothetical protein WC770_06230 [Phycisphaerae bacterium]|jgi:hypothetical protein
MLKFAVKKRHRSGIAFILTMIILTIIAAFAVALTSLASTSVQITDNRQKAGSALSAAQSGIDYAKYFAGQITEELKASPTYYPVTDSNANAVWSLLCTRLNTSSADVVSIKYSDSSKIITNPISFDSDANFTLQFSRCAEPNGIIVRSIGADGDMTRTIEMKMLITKSGEVLNYAIATQSRMWLTGNSTIHGNIYSSWKYQNISPFNISRYSTVEGTINTILTKGTTAGHYDDLYAGSALMSYHLETLDENGNPVYDSSGNKVFNSTDQIQGQCDGINYGVNYGNKAADMPGMKITDYDTTTYYQATRTTNGGGGDIPYSGSAREYTGDTNSLDSTNGTKYRWEYFPHDAGNYTTGSGLHVKRYIYKNQAFNNQCLPVSKNALFINCTFEGVLYINCGTTGSTYNNVRFEDCTFNGPIITNTPNYSNSTNWWMKNCLYFTGEETFDNQRDDIPSTILAPNFNVNLGNTNPDSDVENNILTGAIVGGIVDIRGNAEIKGTVISMFDTSGYSSGYVSNIGATLDDGGSETTESGDIGVINITPDPTKLLPSGIKTPIVITPLQDTYSEINS